MKYVAMMDSQASEVAQAAVIFLGVARAMKEGASNTYAVVAYFFTAF